MALEPWTGIRARAVTPDGAPLSNVRWNVFTRNPDTGDWDKGLQMGPLLTDDDGRMSWAATMGSSYKFCFYDDDYQFNTRSERYADTCWIDSPTEAGATVWTPTEASPVLDSTITLRPAGRSLSVGYPWVDGTAKVGQPLTVRPGTWGPDGVALTYQWVTDESADITPIAGATGTTFTPTAAQSGKAIGVQVTGTLEGYRTYTAYRWIGTVGGTTPTMDGSLTIAGTPMPGNTVTAVPGTLTPADTSVAYDWYVNGKPVGSTGGASTLDITPAMAGGTLEVNMTAYNWDCCDDQFYASAQTEIGGGVVGTKPSISGETIVGSTLQAHDGAWSPTGVSLAHQWLRDGRPIDGATAATYALTTDDIGAKLSVEVSGTLAGGYPVVSKTSDATTRVQGVLTAATPSISGATTVGSTLTAEPGTWGPAGVRLAYEWYADGAVIDGATGPAYELTAAEVDKAITVKVTGTLADYVTQTKTSDPTSKVLGVFTDLPTPTITGAAEAGSTLTADTGDWGGEGITLTYQWFRDSAAIADAVAPTYRLVVADGGARITVRVTASKTGYQSVSATSNPTAPIKRVFVKTSKPKIKGKVKVGRKLTAKHGKWSPKPKYRYQWFRNGKAIKGATHAKYKLKKADRGKRIKVRVTARRNGFLTVIETSKATARVKR